MSPPVDSEVHGSRTQSLRGGKRSLAVAQGEGEGEGEGAHVSIPSKRSKKSRHGPQHHRDFVPTGGSFSKSGEVIQATSQEADSRSDSSASSVHDLESHRSRSVDNEATSHGSVTTGPKLPGDHPILGQNRLVTGFGKAHTQLRSATQDDTHKDSRNDSTSHNSIGESADDAIEISDDTDVDDESEDGGMVINVDDDSVDGAYTAEEDSSSFPANMPASKPTPRPSRCEDSSSDDGEIKPIGKEEYARAAWVRRKRCRNCGEKDHTDDRCPRMGTNFKDVTTSSTEIHGDSTHNQLQDDKDATLSSKPTTAPNNSSAPPRLGDLPAHEFEMQVRYTLFQLQRSQIDLNRPAICIRCLQPGHQERNCPESNYIHCGANHEHASRLCPMYRRCPKCRERGHDVESCISKLKNTTVPCDYCGCGDHLEDACPSRFFPSNSQASSADWKLWISCCICASKTHLVGDCPQRRASTPAAAWSLRSLDPMQISNLSLESGTRKIERDVEIRGAKQEGVMIRGRAGTLSNANPSLRPPDGRRNDSPRRDPKGFEERDTARIRSRGAATSRHDFREGFYRPSSESHSRNIGDDRYEPSYADYWDQPPNRRDKFYATDSFGQRRRPRSPEVRNTRPTKRNDSFQPPLPNEPLPSRLPPPSRQGSRASASANRSQDRGPPGVDSYRPMPSAAKQAWDKFRL